MDDSLPPSAAGPERLSKQLQAAAGRTSPSAGGATGANAAGTLAFIIAQNTISLDEITLRMVMSRWRLQTLMRSFP